MKPQKKLFNWLNEHHFGIGYALAVAIPAAVLGYCFPLIGGAVFGIVGGIMLSLLYPLPKRATKGISFSAKKCLQYSIILIGFGMNLRQVWNVGKESLGVMLMTMTVAFVCAVVFGKILKVPGKLLTLIGAGTAICGGSAIAAVSPVIEAEDKDIAYSIATVFLFNVIAVLLFPALGHFMHLSQSGFGLWAGTAINDTSSVVAAGYAYGNESGDYATVVKLARTTLIVPICLIAALIVALKKKKDAERKECRHPDQQHLRTGTLIIRVFPWFVLGFLAASCVNSFSVLPESILHWLTVSGKFLIILALSAIGLNVDFRKMMQSGIKPIVLGLLVWVGVAVSSLLIQKLSGQW